VWLHVVTSLGWMGQAMALLSLLALSLLTADQSVRVAATSMAERLDSGLLTPLVNASACTGFILSATTSWGFFRHWWVLVKFAITVILINVGIFVLSGALHASVQAARSGTPAPTWSLVIGSAVMAAVIAFQVWVSITKPWSWTPWTAGDTRHAKPPTAPPWLFAAAVAAVLADFAVAVTLGQLLPAASATVLSLLVVTRWRAVHPARHPRRGPFSRPVAISPRRPSPVEAAFGAPGAGSRSRL
jgi:hypothetical protein